jgi:hypothetical protein
LAESVFGRKCFGRKCFWQKVFLAESVFVGRIFFRKCFHRVSVFGGKAFWRESILAGKHFGGKMIINFDPFVPGRWVYDVILEASPPNGRTSGVNVMILFLFTNFCSKLVRLSLATLSNLV